MLSSPFTELRSGDVAAVKSVLSSNPALLSVSDEVGAAHRVRGLVMTIGFGFHFNKVVN